MTSQLNVDTIVDKAGSGGTNVKVANTSTYVSDGGSVTQNTVQGLAKAWVSEDHNTSNEIKDSLNVASVTDVATGVSKFFYTNNMASSEKIALSGMSSGVFNGACNMPSSNGGDTAWSMGTTFWHHATRGNGSNIGLFDCERVVSAILGDLA